MKISIIVPIYNVELYVERCINSILNQSYKEIEVLLIDDGSSDKSSEICDKYNYDHRVKVIHKENEGLVAARKTGAINATGDYILNVDGDDWIGVDYVKGFVECLKHIEYDIVWSLTFSKDYSNYSIEYKFDGCDQGQMLDAAKGRNGFDNQLEISVCVKCVKRELFLEAVMSMDNRITHLEDLSCTLRLLSKTNNVYFNAIYGYHYVQRSDSMVRQSNGNGNDEIMLEDTKKNLQGCNDEKELLNQLYGAYGRVKILHNFIGLQKYGEDIGACLIPFGDINKGDRVVVFGAGEVGKIVVSYLKSSEDLELVAWTDSNSASLMSDDVIDVQKALSKSFDKIVIATTKKLFEKQMINKLLENGIGMEKVSAVDEDILRKVIEYQIG